MTINHTNNQPNNWSFGEKLITHASHIDKPLGSGEETPVSERTKRMLAELVLLYVSYQVYVDAEQCLIPGTNDRIIMGSGEVNGIVVGFDRAFFPLKINDRGEQLGRYIVQMYVAMDSLDDVSASDASDWRGNVNDQLAPDKFVVAIPLQEGLKIADTTISPIPESQPKDDLEALFALDMPQDPHHSELEAIREPTDDDYDYEEYVESIKSYRDAEEKGEITSMERLTQSYEEVALMNEDCTYIGKQVLIESEHLRSPSFRSPGDFVAGRGAKSGVLQKFIYDNYIYKGEPRVDVQAVIYDPLVAYEVKLGRRTTEDADRSPTTAYVPLSLHHKLLVSDSLN
jgi:hypothetical protein